MITLIKWPPISDWIAPKIVYFNENVHGCNGRRFDITVSRRKCYLHVVIIYSYVMPVLSKVKIITPWCFGRSDALLREAKAEGNSTSDVHGTSR